MGDDTWLTVFPTTFHSKMLHDFDSFNVEDLHTVDNGVIDNLFPLLTNSSRAHAWDFLIGHFLGVGHLGHRVGPHHPMMLAKQQQMNDVLKRAVDALDQDILLVVLGDHGMDRKGDHGGDGDLDVSAGLWIYSKGPAFSAKDVPTSHFPHKTFHGEPSPQRSIQQIDLVPTLSLLLGLPIPFNNLGTVIPELFWWDPSGSDYAKALDIHARQVHAYLDAYRNSPSGGELDGVWGDLESSWTRFSASKLKDKPEAAVEFTRLALETCRSLWAQFNPALMVGGLAIIALSLIVGWGVYERSRCLDEWDAWTASLGRKITSSAAVGAALATVAHIVFRSFRLLSGVTLRQLIYPLWSVRQFWRPCPQFCAAQAPYLVVRAHPIAPFNFYSIQLLHLLGRPRYTVFPSLHTRPTGAYRIVCTNGPAPVSHSRLFRPFCGMCEAHGSQHGLPRGATPVVQRHVLLRLGRRRVTHPHTRVAHSCGSPGTVRYSSGAGHLQVRQRHRHSSPTVLRPARADRGLGVLASRIARRVRRIRAP